MGVREAGPTLRFERHITGLFILWVCFIWLGLSGLIFSASLVEGMALKSAQQGTGTLVRIGLWKTVEFAWLVMPAAGSLGALVAGTIAARRGELTGFYSCGGRPKTIIKTWFAASLVWVGLGFYLGEGVVPFSKEELLRLNLGSAKAQALRQERRPVEWVSIDNWRIYLPSISHDTSIFRQPQLLEMDSGRLGFIWNADELTYEGKAWVLRKATRYSLEGEVLEVERQEITLPISPEDLWMVAAPPSVLSREVLVELIEQKRRVGTDYVQHELSLARRVGYPLAFLPLLLLISPFALRANRRRTFAHAVGVGALVIGVAFGVEGLFRMLALGRQLAPAWGGWGLTISASLAAVLYLLHLRRG